MSSLESALPYAVFLAYCAFLTAAAICDAWKYIIPNQVTFGLAGLFLAAAPFLPTPVDWVSHLGAAGAVLAVGIVPFALGKLGGGDVKLITAVSLWTGFEHLLEFLVYASLAGGVVALLLVLARRILSERPAGQPGALPRVLRDGESVPYALAIAPAAILVGGFMPVIGRLWA
jgi:prepilin peptidase CpaA